MEEQKLNDGINTDLQQPDVICSAIKQLIQDGRIIISLYTFPGRGWIDVRVTIDGECLYDDGCAI